MKKLVLALFVLISIYAQAQEKRKSFAFNFGIGDGEIFMRKQLVGGPSLKSKTLNTFGIGYWHEIDKDLFIETGINYVDHSYEIKPVFYPGLTQTPSQVSAPLLTIPIKLRYEFSKYFFLNGGAFVGLALKETDKFSGEESFSGVGASVGLGAGYPLTQKLNVYVNPQFNVHNIFASSKSSTHSLADISLLFGVAYRIK